MSDEEYDYGSDEDEFDYGSDMEDGGVVETSPKVEIENAFYEADDVKTSDPSKALSLFEQVVKLEELKNPSSFEFRFKALSESFKVRVAGSFPRNEIVSSYKRLLNVSQHVTANERTEAIHTALALAAKTGDSRFVMDLYDATAETLDVSSKAYASTMLKKLRFFVNEKLWVDARNAMRNEFDVMTSDDDGAKNSPIGLSPGQQLELLALKIAVYSSSGSERARVRRAYARTLEMSEAVKDPRVMGDIHSLGGKLCMEEGKFEEAYDEFFTAFRCRQEVGDANAKFTLRMCLLANMIARSQINPFDSREARVYVDDPSVKAVSDCRLALEQHDVFMFERALKEADFSEEISTAYVPRLRKALRSSVLEFELRPFEKVSLKYLAERLLATEEEVFRLLVDAINRGKILGSIDCVSGVFEKHDSERDHLVVALSEWTSAVDDSTRRILQGPALGDSLKARELLQKGASGRRR